jgi:hypothetical protein
MEARSGRVPTQVETGLAATLLKNGGGVTRGRPRSRKQSKLVFLGGLGHGGLVGRNNDPRDTNNQFAADGYIVDPGHVFFVETDLVNSTLPSGQVSFGYYAARTPLCASCP